MSKPSRRSFHRRLFLTGAAGVTVGLPFLETFASRAARAATPDNPGFVVFMRQGNGCSQALPYSNPEEPEMFWPRNLGALTAASMAADADRATSELGAYADDLLLVRGVRGALSIGGCGHARGALQALTAQPTGDAEATRIDRVIVDRTGVSGLDVEDAVPIEAIRRAFVEDLEGEIGWDRLFDSIWNPVERLLPADEQRD